MRSALGKGLDALISEDTVARVSAKPSGPTALPLDKVRPNAKQPRQMFAQDSLGELAASIKERGVLQPILVTPMPDGQYEIIAGERRWRAAQLAGLKEIPAIVRGGSETERFEMALIENIQREDLNPIDLANGYRRLQDEFHMTQEAIGKAVGKDRAVVANTLRLLGLPDAIQQALREGQISAGHGRALAAIEDSASQQVLFDRIVAESLPVRAAEEAVRGHKKEKSRKTSTTAAVKSPEIRAIEEDLQRALGRRIELHAPAAREGDAASHKGWLKLDFYSLDDLDKLIAQLKKAAVQ